MQLQVLLSHVRRAHRPNPACRLIFLGFIGIQPHLLIPSFSVPFFVGQQQRWLSEAAGVWLFTEAVGQPLVSYSAGDLCAFVDGVKTFRLLYSPCTSALFFDSTGPQSLTEMLVCPFHAALS
jgi:hypothetical protein